ncbi:RNA-directed DNA polymerase [Candidatus Saccharibacteria bacterium]|nr:RNA-directed DNA polymerase [Candidatus Saccharibacteria bacterium]
MKLVANEDLDWLRDPENRVYFYLYTAYLEARKGGKRKTFDEHKFEVNEFENLLLLMKAIMFKEYRPLRGTAHVIFNPVLREIFAAAFRDRVVHHFIYMIIYDWWDRHFIYDSYSCREGKGTELGIKRLQHHIRSVSATGKQVYVVKMDIQGFFMSLDRRKLYKQALWGLDLQFEGHKGLTYHIVKFCLCQVVMDDPVKGVRRKGWPENWKKMPDTKSLFKQLPGIGIVIGNLTSQLLSNIFLDMLDRYIKFVLGYKHYGRYVDDFYIVVTKEELPKVLADVENIRRFLRRIGLRLHPKKFSVQPAKNGVPFLGAVVYANVIHPGKRLKANARKAFYKYAHGAHNEVSLVSYVGYLKHMKHYKCLCEICESVGLPREYWKNFEKLGEVEC